MRRRTIFSRGRFFSEKRARTMEPAPRPPPAAEPTVPKFYVPAL
jgi:hypothetical protein